jgi:hypothetical protein
MTRATSTPVPHSLSAALRSEIASPVAALLHGVADRLDRRIVAPRGGYSELPASVAEELGAAETQLPQTAAPARRRSDWIDMRGLPGERG